MSFLLAFTPVCVLPRESPKGDPVPLTLRATRLAVRSLMPLLGNEAILASFAFYHVAGGRNKSTTMPLIPELHDCCVARNDVAFCEQGDSRLPWRHHARFRQEITLDTGRRLS